ncbi:hypothetical protein [Streptomyces zaomyceticus]|uniref:hypothetical protein n=1 Tax=Streptomyces zaomyceticus TaxID=68286 RepID=UPI0036C9F351
MVFKRTARAVRGTRAGRIGLGAAAANALLAGAFAAPAGASSAPSPVEAASTSTVNAMAASGIEGTFNFQNYQTKGCIGQEIIKDGLFAHPSAFLCSDIYGTNVWLHGPATASATGIRNPMTIPVSTTALTPATKDSYPSARAPAPTTRNGTGTRRDT